MQQPLLVAERAKAPLVTEKAEVDTESYTARIVSTGGQCEEADHSGHTSHWDLSVWAVSF